MKTFNGKVVSTKMDKTIVVEVTRMWTHPIYRKRVKRTRKYLVHDEENQAKLNDQVLFAQTKPISKLKHFKLISIEGN
jgi:small subunit ribosomal protein S17